MSRWGKGSGKRGYKPKPPKIVTIRDARTDRQTGATLVPTGATAARELRPELKIRRDAAARAMDEGLPSMSEIEILVGWLDGELCEGDAEVAAALLVFQQAHDSVHDFDFDEFNGGYLAALDYVESLAGYASAAKTLMAMRDDGRLRVGGPKP